MPKIVVLDPLADDGLKLMQDAGLEYEVRTGLKGEDPYRIRRRHLS